MQSKKLLAPFWWMVAILLVVIAQSYIVLWTARIAHLSSMRITYLLLFLMWPVVILAEAIVYYIIRKRIRNRKWVWAHIGFMFLGFVVLRLLVMSSNIYVLLHYAASPHRQITTVIGHIQFYTFWSCVVIGHAFFTMVLVNSFSTKKDLPSEELFLGDPY